MQDLYEILQVGSGASFEEISAAYKRLARRYHPDVNPGQDAVERMVLVNQAYAVLSDAHKRKEYDQRRLSAAKKAARAKPPASQKTARKKAAKKKATTTSKPKAQPSKKTPPGKKKKKPHPEVRTVCQNCGAIAPVRKVDIRQNIGMFFVRKENSINGRLCRNCIELHFWKYTGITLLLGWWGFLSLILTPLYLIGNLISYASVLTLRRGEGQPDIRSQTLPWRFTVLVIFLLFVGTVYALFS